MWPTHYIPNQERVEGIPPPRYYLTTPPYPLQIIEAIESAQGTPIADFQPSLDQVETIETVGAPISGTLRSILKTTSIIPEEIESNGLVVSGILLTLLKTASVEIHQLESNGLVISGYLGDPLVRYENWPLGFDSEDLISAGQPVSGALT